VCVELHRTRLTEPQNQRTQRRSDQRLEQRFAASTSVAVTILGVLGEPKFLGVIVDMSGSGLRLNLPLPVPLGAPVKIETGDMLMLGEVVRCEPAGQTFSVGIAVSQSLTALAELERLNRALLGTEDTRVRGAIGDVDYEFARSRR
jgi:PilZ domain